jgi:uncharacterized delta-60 repeat protein
MPVRVFTFAVLLVSMAGTRAFAYGEFDSTYSSTPAAGWSCAVVASMTPQSSFAPLPDDSVYFGVTRTAGAANGMQFALAKARPDGTLDPSWQGGIAPLGPPGTSIAPGLILPLPDGGAIVGIGTFERLRADGSIDTSYGNGGISDVVRLPIQSAALQADGSVVALGAGEFGFGDFESAIYRFRPDGHLDTSFGNGGEIPISPPVTSGSTIYAWSVRDDGSVEVGFDRGFGIPRFVLHRFPVDFTAADNPAPRVMPRAGLASWVGPMVQVDGAGGAVFAVLTTNAGTGFGGVLLMRVLPDGTFDAGFGLDVASPRGPDARGTSALAVKLWRSADGKWTAFLDVFETDANFGPPLVGMPTFAVRFGANGRVDSTFPTDVGLQGNSQNIRLNTGKLVVGLNNNGSCQLERLLTDDEPRVDGILVEYFHPVLRHYFITLDTFEAAILDSNPGGWVRTGQTFPAWQPVAAPATTAVCRFYGDPVIGPNSHFYTPEGPECDALIALEHATPPGVPVWHLEAKPFRASLPGADGTCPGNLDPVYRVFNGPVDNAHGPAHRYTTDPALYAQMQSLGWLPEGAHFCVPPLGPR